MSEQDIGQSETALSDKEKAELEEIRARTKQINMNTLLSVSNHFMRWLLIWLVAGGVLGLDFIKGVSKWI